MQTFNPPVRTLMGPGPSDVYPRVLEALSRPTIGHLDPAFIRMMDELKELLQYAFQTRNAMTMPVSAPGSAGMETCFVNLLEPGDEIIVETALGEHVFAVREALIVLPTDVWVTNPKRGAWLTLTTCHPRFSNCGMTNEKMISLFEHPKSPFDIHTVDCINCHPKGVPPRRNIRPTD